MQKNQFITRNDSAAKPLPSKKPAPAGTVFGKPYAAENTKPSVRPARAPVSSASIHQAKKSAAAMTKNAPGNAVTPDLSLMFKDFDIPATLLQSIEAMKYTQPTPIQAGTIPPALQGRDILGCAQTGTGKTAAFLIPLVSQLLKSPYDTALILAPTRELAAQTESVLKALTVHNRTITHALLIGGMSMQPQTRALQKKPRVIIATPGRLLDHLDRRAVSLQKTTFLVLDEADRMLDMGFAPQLRDILKVVPSERQTLLFTATLPPNIRKITQNYLKSPAEVIVGAVSKAVDRIKQSSIVTDQKKKNDVVLDEINARKGSIIIFARTQRRADKLHHYLADFGLEVGVIHGGKTQGQRNRALQGFRDSITRVLVATDVASRGLDIPHVAHVINFDLPDQPEDYVHRIGRTARAGQEGEALSFITPEDRHLWKAIQQLQK